MPNKERDEVSIRLDRVRTLKYDLNALAEFEEAAGRSMFDMFRALQEKRETFGVRTARLLLWAGLLHEDPSLTVRQAGDLVKWLGDSLEEQLEQLMEKINEAMLCLQAKDDEKKGRTPNGTGIRHSPSLTAL